MERICSSIIIIVLLSLICLFYVENQKLKGNFTTKVTTIKEIFSSSLDGSLSNNITVDGEKCNLTTRKTQDVWGTYIFNKSGMGEIIFAEYHQTKEDAVNRHFEILNGGVKADDTI